MNKDLVRFIAGVLVGFLLAASTAQWWATSDAKGQTFDSDPAILQD